MMMCVRSVRYSIQVNSDMVGPIIPGRGLRQGDPLSPFLFMLCMEGLLAAINQACVHMVLHGNKICRAAPEISHLFFADDSILFCRATIEEVQALKDLLNKYERVSKQAIKLWKIRILEKMW